MSTLDARSSTEATGTPNLHILLAEASVPGDAALVVSGVDVLSVDDVRTGVDALAAALRNAGVGPGQPVGALVGSGPEAVLIMFAIWSIGAAYVPINRRLRPSEVRQFLTETPIALLIGSRSDLREHTFHGGLIEHSMSSVRVLQPADAEFPCHDQDVALVLRTSGTTGQPKAVLLRHSGTIDALDASLAKLRRSSREPRSAARQTQEKATPRMNLIPVSLALWAGIFNVLFALRAGAGVVLLEQFTPVALADAVRAHDIRSTVLPPAMITALNDATDIDGLAPLRMVRSITAPLPPQAARRFHQRFGVMVLNSYGQTELGGEVVGWTAQDVRTFGESKLGSAGRAYDDVDVRIRDEQGSDLAVGETGEIHVRSPFRMHGYADSGRGNDSNTDRFVRGYLRTGDLGRIDEDGFLWIQGRLSDMINRGGLKIFPDEVEDVLRRHPAIRDACVAGVPDRRLGEVPHAWLITDDVVDEQALISWCRRELAPYKVPTGFNRVEQFPRSEVGKVQRRVLAAEFVAEQGGAAAD